MGDSQPRVDQTTIPGATEADEIAALREQLAMALEQLAERDRAIAAFETRFSEPADETAALRNQLTTALDRLAERDGMVFVLREEVRALKNHPRRPDMKPSGMAASAEAASSKKKRRSKRGRGAKRHNPKATRRDVIVRAEAEATGAVHKGYAVHTVRDIVIRAEEVRYLREVWQLPDGRRLVAEMPEGVASGKEQYGSGLKAFVVMLYHQGQSTVGRITTLLNDIGLDISRRKVMRILNEDTAGIVTEAGEILKAGMDSAGWINVDDTGARHKGTNGFCTTVGNDLFTHFRSRGSKSRLNFLDHLCADDNNLAHNDAAFDYMRRMKLSGKVIRPLVDHPRKHFPGRDAWLAHLETLGITLLKVHPDPVRVATEGACWGTIAAAGRIAGTVILSDDAGQFNVGDAHALCWVHAERLIHKTFCAPHRPPPRSAGRGAEQGPGPLQAPARVPEKPR